MDELPDPIRRPIRCRPTCRLARRRGLTLIETMAALLLVAIALPVAMRGVSVATAAGAAARHRGEAAALAQSKLAQLVATGDWQLGDQSGEFGAEWSDYRWDSAVSDWTMIDMKQVDVTVSWDARGNTSAVTLSTLVYEPPEDATPGTASGSSAGAATGEGRK